MTAGPRLVGEVEDVPPLGRRMRDLVDGLTLGHTARLAAFGVHVSEIDGAAGLAGEPDSHTVGGVVGSVAVLEALGSPHLLAAIDGAGVSLEPAVPPRGVGQRSAVSESAVPVGRRPVGDAHRGPPPMGRV